MPTYHYICRKCGHEFECFQSMKDEPLKSCPKDRCARQPWAKGRVDRQMSGGAGLIFKGSGFYITDYRSEGYKQAARKESEGGAAKKDAAAAKPAVSSGSGSTAGTGGSSAGTGSTKKSGESAKD